MNQKTNTAPKHAPATPLPWNVGAPTTDAVDGQRGIWSGKRGVADVYGYPQTASYIAHAANAYPKLVEALRGQVAKAEANYAGAMLEREIGNVRALLRELGEDA